jgi:hypothetical protein
MSFHLHRTRQWTAWVLSVIALSPFALAFGSTPREDHLSPITGSVTLSGRPMNDMFICIDSDGQHIAYGTLADDGTFCLHNMAGYDSGAMPGHYRAHLFTHTHGPKLPSRYLDPKTSGLEMDVATGWNDFRIELH